MLIASQPGYVPRGHNFRGFSIVELLISISVMAILMATVAPAVGNWMVGSRVRSATEAVLSGLQKARVEAIRRNQTVSFWLVSSNDPTKFDSSCALSTDSASWVISRDDPTGKCNDDPATKVAEFYDWFSAGNSTKGLLIAAKDSSAAAASSVKFDSLGHVISTGNPIKTIDFTSEVAGTRKPRLLISVVGSVRMCDLDATAPDPRAC
jgi:type IV fimbrial biogenesis protein FimT